jgi:hypothetical protein
MTDPGSARDWTRAATLGASPNTALVASTTTWFQVDTRYKLRRVFAGVPGVEFVERPLDG